MGGIASKKRVIAALIRYCLYLSACCFWFSVLSFRRWSCLTKPHSLSGGARCAHSGYGSAKPHSLSGGAHCAHSIDWSSSTVSFQTTFTATASGDIIPSRRNNHGHSCCPHQLSFYGHSVEKWRSTGSHHSSRYSIDGPYQAFLSLKDMEVSPSTYKQACKYSYWCDAMRDEYDALRRNNTCWYLVYRLWILLDVVGSLKPNTRRMVH